MKKIQTALITLLALTLSFVLAGCGSGGAAEGGGASGSSAAEGGSDVVYRTLDEIKESGTINIGVFSDKNPFGYVDENGEYQGYDVYFAQRLGEDLGVEVNYVSTEAANRVAVLDQSAVAEEGRVSEVFINPKSEIARELILPDQKKQVELRGGRRVRLSFQPGAAQKPLISELILECQLPINILFAQTKELDGVAYGQMLIELPREEREAERILTWLKKSPIEWREEA